MRKAFAASFTRAGDLFRSGKVELVDVPVPKLVGNKQDPLNEHKMENPGAPTWDLTAEQQQVVRQAKVIVMDQHSGGPTKVYLKLFAIYSRTSSGYKARMWVWNNIWTDYHTEGTR